MDVFKSKVLAGSADFQAKHKAMTELIAGLNEELVKALDQGAPAAQARHKKAGKMLARDRLQLILDPDTPFLELLPLAGCRAKDRARNIAVIGIVNGVECLVTTSIPTIKGGSTNEHSLRKSLRIMEIAQQNRLPIVACIETAGADLTQQAKVFHMGGAMFRDLARLSKAGVPTIALVFGSSTAGGAYAPGLSDYVVMVKNQAQVFLAGPPLVKAATGEEADEESLGGAEMHSKKSGVSDYLAQDEEHAIYLGRQIVAQMNYKKRTQLPREHFSTVQPPLYDPDEILGIVGGDIRTPYDSREVITRIVDGSRFHEFKPEYATTIVTCWARIHGVLVGILANNGVLFSDTANKAAHFIQICDKRAIPLVYLQNITGFMVGQKQEQDGIIKHGSKLINAVANASVPAITIVMGSSFGAGNYAMAGRAYQARFLFAWPGSKVAVMGSDQLVTVLGNIGREAAAKSQKEYDEKAAAMATAAFKKRVEAESEAFYITSECLDDGIIDPRDTRDVIGICLSVVHNSAIVPGETYGISRM